MQPVRLAVTVEVEGSLSSELLEIRKRVLGEEHPGTLNTMKILAQAINAQCRHAEAHQLIDDVLTIQRRERGPKDLSTLSSMLSRANFFGDQDFLEEAVDAYHELIMLKPDYDEAYHNLGHVLFKQEKLDEALEAYRKAIELNPNFAVAYNLGVVLVKQGKLDEAIAYYRKAIKLNPNFVDAYNNLGIVLVKQGKLDEAIAHYRKALEIVQQLPSEDKANNGRLANGSNNLAWLLATCQDERVRDPTEAVALAKRAVELAPKQGGYFNTLGVAQYRAGNYADAIEACEKSIELASTGTSHDFLFIAMGHSQLRQQDEARKWMEKATAWMDDNAPDDEELIRFRAEAEELIKAEAEEAEEIDTEEKESESKSQEETSDGDGEAGCPVFNDQP